ncbi:hypothetical protein HI914_00445 [Erysiphe necator]|uniref:Putative checkpoint protein hus1 protein n=1 Tax=Uncinula necator TaxID=52586 RepID=A0A0B1P2B2_UNCNE|nr:hypothetical protein HI914_00445 [Erysiphe necator]KHJ32787.1 putative checkpoint protein hus1 protein [Erysiphe necator]
MERAYMPHPAPEAQGKKYSIMGFFSVFKTLAVTAIISLTFYLILSFVVVPIWKRYRRRYSNYLLLDRVSSNTFSVHQRVQAMIIKYLSPSFWGSQFLRSRHLSNADEGSDFDDDDGEELYEVDNNRREALSLDALRDHSELGSRLSRDLEEGFRDDSDESDSEINILSHCRIQRESR